MKQHESAQPNPSNVEPVSASDLPTTWQRLLDILAAKGPGIPSILSHGELKSVADGKAVIEFTSTTFAAMIDRNGKKDVIRDELSKLLDKPVSLAIEVSEHAEAIAMPQPAPQKRAIPASAPKAAIPSAPISTGLRITPELKQELREKNPLIAAVMTELGGEIVKVE